MRSPYLRVVKVNERCGDVIHLSTTLVSFVYCTVVSYTWEKFLTPLFTLVKVLEKNLRRTFCSLSPTYFVLWVFNKRPTQLGHFIMRTNSVALKEKKIISCHWNLLAVGRTELQFYHVLQQLLLKHERLQCNHSNVLHLLFKSSDLWYSWFCKQNIRLNCLVFLTNFFPTVFFESSALQIHIQVIDKISMSAVSILLLVHSNSIV